MRKHPNTINYEEFGKRLRESREGMDLTQEEFGARINYSGEYVGRLERGEGQFSVQFIADVHDEFGISTDYLLFGTKQGKAYNTKEDHIFILHDNGGEFLRNVRDFYGELSPNDQYYFEKNVRSSMEIIIHTDHNSNKAH